MIVLEWYHSQGTQSERPQEVDLDSAKASSFSQGFVFLRKNIQRIEVEDPTTGEKTWLWDYDEAVLPRSDYGIYASEQNATNIDENSDAIIEVSEDTDTRITELEDALIEIANSLDEE